MRPNASYRLKSSGGGIRNPGKIEPDGALTSVGTLVLLIHGYNNDEGEAERSYEQFFTRQEEIAPVFANVVSVYWSGDNWEGAVYYMQAISKAKDTAPLLAADLCKAATAKGYLSVNIIAHSLGCRLALETIEQVKKILMNDPAPIPIIISSVIFMAGAVPVSYIDNNKDGRLRAALEKAGKTMSMYSKKDTVLHWAFGIGESLGGDGFFPRALGRKYWEAGDLVPVKMRQEENTGAGHSDYWGGDSKKTEQLKRAAGYIRSFVDLGTPPPRTVEARSIDASETIPARETTQGRTVDVREVC